jgi:predicted AAA+ superfamily ATPase
MQFTRRIMTEIETQIGSKEIILVTGMRRVGKTTLMRMLYEKIESANKVFLDLENIIEQKIFEEIDYNNIWANLSLYGLSNKEKAYIFIDEIQTAPGVVKAIKYLYDHYNVKFFLTGSSSFYLKNLFSESLAGRKIIFELFPLDFQEFLIFKEVTKNINNKFEAKSKNKSLISYEKYKAHYQEYMIYGGFPQVVLVTDPAQKEIYLKDIFISYFEKDVKILADFRRINIFRDLLLLLMERTGSKLEITKLASEIGVSRETVYNYLSFLQSTYFVSLISPFSRNVDREVSGTKKIYFCDNGILTIFSKISGGALLENCVYNTIRKYGKINYYQKRSGAEIDFILPEKNIALEIKKKGTLQEYKRLSKTASSLGMNEWYIVSQLFTADKGMIPALDL